MTAAAHCPICLDHFRIDADKPQFVVFLCGHGFCKSCTSQLFPRLESTARCPNCREFIHQRDGHPVYLEFVDSKLAAATELVKGFRQMNADTPLSNLKEASVKLEHVSKEIPDRVVALLQSAIKDFNERIIPHFTTFTNQKQEIETLQKELRKSHRERQLLANVITVALPVCRGFSLLRVSVISSVSAISRAALISSVAVIWGFAVIWGIVFIWGLVFIWSFVVFSSFAILASTAAIPIVAISRSAKAVVTSSLATIWSIAAIPRAAISSVAAIASSSAKAISNDVSMSISRLSQFVQRGLKSIVHVGR